MKKYSSLIAINLTLLTLGAVFYVLYIGSPIFIPFVVALLFSFIILSITGYFHRAFLLPKYIAFILSLLIIAIIFWIITGIINANVTWIITRAPDYQEKLETIFLGILQKYNINSWEITKQWLDNLDIQYLLTTTFSIFRSIITNAGIIMMFMVFILLESTTFYKKVALISGGENSSFFKIYGQIRSDITSYFMIKTVVSLMVAILSAIIMLLFWVDFWLFWAFVIFLLNYIPNIGSIVAVTFPVLLSLIQFESFSYTALFLIVMVGAQVFVGNFLEPKLMGQRLNLSPLVILFSLMFWGYLWGPIGMLLSVPIMVSINIVLAHIPATRNIAILLSERWVVKFYGEDTKNLTLKKMKKLLKYRD